MASPVLTLELEMLLPAAARCGPIQIFEGGFSNEEPTSFSNQFEEKTFKAGNNSPKFPSICCPCYYYQ